AHFLQIAVVDNGQKIAAMDVVEQIERAVERAVKIIHARGIDARVGAAVRDDADAIDALPRQDAFVRIREKAPVARRRKSESPRAVRGLATVELEIGAVERLDGRLHRKKLLDVGIV